MGNGYDDRPLDAEGRLVDRILKVEERLRETERPSGTQVTRTVGYLSSLATHVATDADVVFSGFPLEFSTGTARITTTTDEPLIARVSYSAYVFVSVRSGNVAGSAAYYGGTVALNGSRIGSVSWVSAFVAPSSGGHNINITNEYAFTCERIVTVPPGENVFTHQYRGLLQAAGGGGDASGDRSNGILTVQFIGRP